MHCASISANCLPAVIPIVETDEKVFGVWKHFFFSIREVSVFPTFVPKQVIFSAILVSDLTLINSLTVFVLK